MNFKNILFGAPSALVLLSCLGFWGCDKSDPEAFISVSRTEVEAEYTGLSSDGETISFELGSNHAWKATHVEEWIHLNHSEGDRGRVRIFLTIDENNTGKDRQGFVVFEGGGNRRTIAVTQKLKVDALTVSPLKITLMKSGRLESGDLASIYLSTNCDWKIDVPAESKWIAPETLSGPAGSVTVVLNAEMNRTDGTRTGTFTVTAGLREATVTVTQTLEGLTLSETEFQVNRFGFVDEAQTPLTFTVKAAESWTSQGDGWLTLTPSSGEAGETEVTLGVGLNETGAPRSGSIRILTQMTGMEAAVEVSQNARNSLFEDDGKAIGYQYYFEDFSWTSEFSGAVDCVGKHTQSGAVNIYSKGDDGVYRIAQSFTDAGLTDFNPDDRTIYACAGYLKMGKGSAQTGIVIPALSIPEGQCTDVELTFVAASNIGGDGTGTPDAVTVTVEILEGPGGIDSPSGKVSEPMTPGVDWEWTPMSVKLYGITENTRFVIRSTQQGQSGYFRWYLDNVRLVKTASN